MEAIFEMLAAVLIGMIEAAIFGIQVLASFLALILEVCFTAIFRGRVAAAERYRLRQAATLSLEPTASSQSADVPVDAAHSRPRISGKATLAIWTMVLLIAVGTVGTKWYQQRLTKQRIERTNQQIEALANGFSDQVKQRLPKLPEGQLPDQDAWGTHCELFVDEWLLGTLIVVRSWGPDCRHGTLDDLLEIRLTRPPWKVFGKKLAIVGLDMIQDRIKKMLPDQAVDPRNMDIRIDE